MAELASPADHHGARGGGKDVGKAASFCLYSSLAELSSIGIANSRIRVLPNAHLRSPGSRPSSTCMAVFVFVFMPVGRHGKLD